MLQSSHEENPSSLSTGQPDLRQRKDCRPPVAGTGRRPTFLLFSSAHPRHLQLSSGRAAEGRPVAGWRPRSQAQASWSCPGQWPNLGSVYCPQSKSSLEWAWSTFEDPSRVEKLTGGFCGEERVKGPGRVGLEHSGFYCGGWWPDVLHRSHKQTGKSFKLHLNDLFR